MNILGLLSILSSSSLDLGSNTAQDDLILNTDEGRIACRTRCRHVPLFRPIVIVTSIAVLGQKIEGLLLQRLDASFESGERRVDLYAILPILVVRIVGCSADGRRDGCAARPTTNITCTNHSTEIGPRR